MSTPNADWDEVRAMVERPLWTDFDENKVQQAYVAMEIEKRDDRRPDYPF